MELTLTITASASALAKILASLDDSAVVAAPSHVINFTGLPVATQEPVVITEGPLVEAAAQPVVMPEVVAAAPTIAGEPEFDSSGLAWDERIHSKQKGQTNDGKWRKQRGVDENYYKQVEAELRARYGAQVSPEVAQPAPIAMPMPVAVEPVTIPQLIPNSISVTQVQPGNVPPMPIMSMPDVDMEHQVDDADNVVSEPVAVIPMPVLAPEPVAVAAPSADPITFHTIMMHIGTAMGNGTITPDYLVQLVGEINQQCGTTMQSFTDMAAFPQTIDYCWAALHRDGKL